MAHAHADVFTEKFEVRLSTSNEAEISLGNIYMRTGSMVELDQLIHDLSALRATMAAMAAGVPQWVAENLVIPAIYADLTCAGLDEQPPVYFAMQDKAGKWHAYARQEAEVVMQLDEPFDTREAAVAAMESAWLGRRTAQAPTAAVEAQA